MKTKILVLCEHILSEQAYSISTSSRAEGRGILLGSILAVFGQRQVGTLDKCTKCTYAFLIFRTSVKLQALKVFLLFEH